MNYPPFPSPPAPGNHWVSLSIDLLVLDVYIKGVIQYVTFCAWLLLLSAIIEAHLCCPNNFVRDNVRYEKNLALRFRQTWALVLAQSFHSCVSWESCLLFLSLCPHSWNENNNPYLNYSCEDWEKICMKWPGLVPGHSLIIRRKEITLHVSVCGAWHANSFHCPLVYAPPYMAAAFLRCLTTFLPFI